MPRLLALLAWSTLVLAAPVIDTPGGTRVLPVAGDWQGDDLATVADGELGEPCLEWFQDPATRGKATLVVDGVNPAEFDVLRLQWKHLGGGAGLSVRIGKRHWYLFKTAYTPGIWRDCFLQLDLDDDGGGPLLDDQGRFVVELNYYNLAQNRADEQAWRRVRVRNLALIRFPVRLDCDPKAVRCEADDAELRTVFPMRLQNRTDAPREVRLFLEPGMLRDFTGAFANDRVTVPAGATVDAPLVFRIPAATAADRDPLTIEEAPVYAEVVGDPWSLTTWYRAYVQWRPGGVIPPRRRDRPLMLPPGTADRIRDLAAADPEAASEVARLTDVKTALARPVLVPELRHGYSGHNICPEHQKPVRFEPDDFTRQWCPTGEHWVTGVAHLDRAAALARHTTNSADCRRLGLAWYLAGNAAAARKAADLLLAYADRYPEWDYSNPGAVGYWSRVAHAVLGECWWIHDFVSGYDCIADWDGLTPAEHARIRHFFAVAAEDIQSHRVSKNQQCEINAASGGAAVDAGAWYLAARAFTGDYGLRDQIELAFSDEGFSRENEFGYHYAAMLPIVHQGVAWEAMGANFFDPRVKRIFDAPLAFSISQKLGWAGMYAIAHSRYRDPRYRRQIADGKALEERLLYGGWELPPLDAEASLVNSSLPLAGKAVLRRGMPDALRAAQVSWGAPTQRGGQDMLNTLLSFHGTDLNRSVSRIGYGYAVKGLSYVTLAGNLPIVDGQNQTGVRPAQVFIRDGEFPAARYHAPATAPMYPGVTLTRTIAIVGDAFVIVDRLTAAEPHRYEFTFYPAADEAVAYGGVGGWTPYPEFATDGIQYDCVQDVERTAATPAVTAEYVAGGSRFHQPETACRAHFLTDGDATLVRGRTHTGWHPYLTPLLVLRREAKSAVCVLVVQAGRPDLPYADVKLVEAGDRIVVDLRGPGGNRRLLDTPADFTVAPLE